MFAEYDVHGILLLIIFLPIIVWCISKVLVLVHCIALAITMHKKRVLHPVLAFIPIVRQLSEGYVVSDCLKLSFGKGLVCKILYVSPSLIASPSTILTKALSDKPEIADNLAGVSNTQELYNVICHYAEPAIGMLVLCILICLVLLGVSCYIEITRFLVLKSVGYSVAHSLLIILFLSSFYLYFVNSKLEAKNEEVVAES